MPTINFDGANWAAISFEADPSFRFCPTGGIGNTMTEPATMTSFIIGEGSMWIQSPGGFNNQLAWSKNPCGGGVGNNATLVIRFSTPQQYVRFSINPHGDGSWGTVVRFYETPLTDDPGQTPLLHVPFRRRAA